MGNCKDCKWWGEKARRTKNPWRYCNFLDLNPSSGLDAIYSQGIITTGSFGRVHFDPAKPAQHEGAEK